MFFVDTHAHIDFDDISPNKAKLIEYIKAIGIQFVINPGVRPEDFCKVIELIDQYDYIYGALGIHPTESSCWSPEIYQVIEESLEHPKITAIGETGLDYYHNPDDKLTQQHAFQQQIELALKYNKPLIIHNRDAHEDTLNILKEYQAYKVGGVFHCYNGSVDFAKRCVEHNFYIGIGGVVTFKKATELQEVVRVLPLENILLETDSPFLSPHPERGCVNNPMYIPTIAFKVAQLKNISLEDVAAITTQNAVKLFNLPQ